MCRLGLFDLGEKIFYILAMLEDGRSCRKPSYAGSFYPSEKFQLEKVVNEYIKEADVPKATLDSDILAIVSPHAGYKYSGVVAGYSYKAVAGKNYDIAIILAPSHHFYLNFFVIDDRDYYQIPLGVLKVNKEIVEFLRYKGGFEVAYRVQDEEHSLEVQLPFLYQAFMGKIEIVPILYGEETRSFMTKMAHTLIEVIDEFPEKKVLIVVSTDLSHYHSYSEAYEIDSRLAGVLVERDFEKFVSLIGSKKVEACGAGPLGTFIYLSNIRNKNVEVLKLLNSGDTSGTRDFVVGYMSAVMY
ncbi:MAG: AmmeMemoRadiSam system protein B [Brevinematia bacterium]